MTTRAAGRLLGGGAAVSLGALAAGAVQPLALAPFDVWPLMLVSTGLLFWLLRRTATGGKAFWRGWLFGVGKYGTGASWVYVSIHVYGPTEPPVAIGLVALFVAGMALFNAALAWAFRRCAVGRGGSAYADALAFAVLWTGLEWALTWFLTGFPWLFAGYAFIGTPLAGLAPVGGVLLVSFAAILTATLLTVALTQPPRYWQIGALVVPAAIWLLAWGLGSVSWTAPGAPRSVALVQGNLAQETKWNPASIPFSKARYQELSKPVGDRDIIVWPEAAIPDLHHRAVDFIDAVGQRIAGDLVLGIVVAKGMAGDAWAYYNAAVSTGGGVYRKRRLVPFGDYVPLESVLRGAISFFDLPMSRTVPGDRRQPLLRAAGIDLAMAICYEIAYPVAVARHGRNAAALVTISNDTWFGASIGPLQHLQIARMRALENGKYLLRATNNGVTAIVDHRGEVTARLPQFEAGVLTGEIRAVSGSTPFARLLNLPILFALLAAIAASAMLRFSTGGKAATSAAHGPGRGDHRTGDGRGRGQRAAGSR